MRTWQRLERVLALVSVLQLGACGAAPGLPAPSGRAAPSDYRIGPEDVLEVVVWGNEGVSRRVPVRPDGMISLPLVDDVRAAGLTPMELRDQLTERLRRFLPEPSVSVIVQEVHSPKVTVAGEVERPGRFELTAPMTVLDAIALAGGFKVFASSSRVMLLRAQNGSVALHELGREEMADDGSSDNVWLQPGDIVMVP